LTAGRQYAGFYKGFGNFFLDGIWTLDGFGLRGMRCVRINQLSPTKLL